MAFHIPTVDTHSAAIPVLGLGTWQLKGHLCETIVSDAVRSGYTHVDTAAMYENETDVGAGLRTSGADRDSYILTTKVWPTEVRQGAFRASLEASLQRLQLDHVDLVLIHWPPKSGDPAEWAALLDDVIDAGLARFGGVSNFTLSQLDGIVAAAKHKPVCNQLEHHPYLDQSRMREACIRHGMALVAYCPLYRGGPLFEEPAVMEAAAAHNKTPAQVVLRWHVQQQNGIAIPKTGTPGRLPENADIFDFELSELELHAISALGSANDRICDFEFSPEWD